MASDTIEIILVLLFFVILGVSFAPKLKLPIEVILLLGSLVISFIPELPEVTLQPDIVFLIFLPPILFAAAYFTSWRDFKYNLRPIFLLAIGLVLFTTFFVGLAVKYLIPDLSWAHAFLLGAIVSPPDASAATAIAKKLSIPRRLITVIEGESLINDATALVAYRFALAAILTGTFSIWEASLRFIWITTGGAIIGLSISYAGIWLMQKLKDSKAETVLSLVIAFACFFAAEHFGVSGVISTVAGGLYFGRKLPTVTSAQTRIEAKTTWDMVLFAINGFIFTLIGLQLPAIIQGLTSRNYSFGELLQYGASISVVVILIRIVWVFPAAYIPRWMSASLRKRDPVPPWQAVAILSWTGMRGIVSLAAVLALPEVLPNGQDFPYRDLLIFLTYCVILTTLLLPSFTLPHLLKLFGLKDGGDHSREEAIARVTTTNAVIARLKELQQRRLYPEEILEQFLKRFERRLRSVQSNLKEEAFSELSDEDLAIRRLTRDLLEAERKSLQDLRAHEIIHDEVFHSITQELDLEDLRLKTPRL